MYKSIKYQLFRIFNGSNCVNCNPYSALVESHSVKILSMDKPSVDVMVMGVVELDLMNVEIKALKQNELDLKSGRVLLATPVLNDGTLNGVEVKLTDKVAFTLYNDGRIELGCLDVKDLSTYSLEVTDDVSSVRATGDGTVQSLLMGIIHLLSSALSGSLKCSLRRLSMLERIVLKMLERSLDWHVEYEADHVSVATVGREV